MTISPGQIATIGRHALTFVMGNASGALMAGVALHLMSQNDANAALNALNQISDGLASVATGTVTLVAMASAAYAAMRRSADALRAAVAADPTTIKIVSDPITAAADPSSKVVSPAQNKTAVLAAANQP